MTEEIPRREARQGRKGFHVLTVLLVGLALLAVAYFVIELIWR